MKQRTDKPRPVIDAGRCDNCGICVEGCPSRAIQETFNTTCAKCVKYCLTYQVPCTPRALIVRPELCTGCGRCVEICPRGAIAWEEEG
ncbi:MAG: 4Fe-4S binding protein [Myxococcales bacterium]|nr:4Fe-4S binding protein [Myxococcales bacterium]